jgi:hypothetical protein
MAMTLDEYTKRFPDRNLPVPAEYAGQWVAWNQDCDEILSHGDDMRAVRDQAVARGCERPVLQKVPRAPFVGQA